MSRSRRSFLAAALAAPVVLRARPAAADTVTIRIGALKLIHSITPWFYERFVPAGYRVEIIPFESPTDGKDAVVTKSVDFGTFGIAAAILGAAAHEPVVVFGSSCNKGMAVVARKDSPIATLKDLKGKRVAIWPGSTQEVFILERLHMEGMTIHDIQSVRVSFSEMPAALQRGDVDAYVGAEPGPGLSLATRRRQDRRVSVFDADGQPEHDLRRASRHAGEQAGPRAHRAELAEAGEHLRHGASRRDGGDDGREARHEAGSGGAVGEECRAELADVAGDDRRGQDLCGATCWS